MNAPGWHEGPLLGFDTETTGVDVWNDKIITAALVYKPSYSEAPIKYEWMINIGMDIPEQATRIHGISNEVMREHGQDARTVLDEIQLLIQTFCTEKQATVLAYNAPYDLTILRENLLAVGGTHTGILEQVRVIDPWVIDKQTDKYRKGKRNLTTLAESFGIDSTGAHGALADVIMTMKVAYKLAAKFPKLQVPASVIHDWQVQWKAQQNADYESYLRKTKPDATVDGTWPIEPPRAVQEVTAGGMSW